MSGPLQKNLFLFHPFFNFNIPELEKIFYGFSNFNLGMHEYQAIMIGSLILIAQEQINNDLSYFLLHSKLFY